MKASYPRQQLALTRVDILVILTVTALLGLLLLPALHRTKTKSQRIQCVSNLKQLGLSFRITALNNVHHPLSLNPTTDAALSAFRSHSNLLANTRLLHCPSDTRPVAESPGSLTRSNISYFINPNASERFPQSLLYGDRNLTSNNVPVPPGLIPIPSKSQWSWGPDMHGKSGNVALGDGSVQQINSERLNLYFRLQQGATNWLAVP